MTAQRTTQRTTERTFALLGVTGTTPGQVRAACNVLAGLSLQAADGDQVAAGAILRGALEAIGVLPYESPGKYPYGRLRPAEGRKGDPA